MGRIPTRALALACALGAGLAAPGVLWAADTSPTSTAATSSTSTTAPAESPPQDAAATTTTEAPPVPPTTTTTAAPPPPPPPPPPKPASAPRPARSKPIARAAASGGVTIQGFAFHPGSVTVSVGDTVTWTNHDSADHTATASDGSFDTGTLGRGQSGSHTFTRAGTFSYICSIHPNMHGTVVVVGSSSSSGSGSAASPASGSGSSSSTSATPAATGSSLPNTGLQVGAVALLGLALLGAGGLLRRALRAREQS